MKNKRRPKPRWRIERQTDAGEVLYTLYAHSQHIAEQLADEWAEPGIDAVIYRRRYSVYLHWRTVSVD